MGPILADTWTKLATKWVKLEHLAKLELQAELDVLFRRRIIAS